MKIFPIVFFFQYIKMTNNVCEKHKEKLQKEAPKRYQNLSEDKKKLGKYQNLAEKEKKVSVSSWTY